LLNKRNEVLPYNNYNLIKKVCIDACI